MTSIINYFFGTPEVKTEIEDPICSYFPESVRDELFCFVLQNCTLYTLKPKKGKQDKECDFMHCSLSLGS